MFWLPGSLGGGASFGIPPGGVMLPCCPIPPGSFMPFGGGFSPFMGLSFFGSVPIPSGGLPIGSMPFGGFVSSFFGGFMSPAPLPFGCSDFSPAFGCSAPFGCSRGWFGFCGGGR